VIFSRRRVKLIPEDAQHVRRDVTDALVGRALFHRLEHLLRKRDGEIDHD